MNNMKKIRGKWGTPVWILVHFVCEFIDINYFNKHKLEVFNMLKTLCCNVPCPICSKHASNYLRKIDPRRIDTKNKLRVLFFTFHNYANRNSKSPQFMWADLKKYRNVRINAVVRAFLQTYPKQYYGNFNFTGNARRKIAYNFLKWLQKIPLRYND